MNAVALFWAMPRAIREQFRIWKSTKKMTSIGSRLYIYSIVFDPFLFFVIADRLTVGFSLTLSRGIQVIFYSLLIFRFFGLKKKSDVFTLNSYWNFFLIFLVYVFSVYLVSFVLGFNFVLKNSATQTDTSTAFAAFLSGPSVRPFIELFVLIFTISHYFWVGPRILKTKEHFQFLCSSFLLLCYISLALGLISFISALLFGQNLLPRHFVEYLYPEPSYSGVRFQGLAGEPRDAFGQVVMFIVMFYFFTKICVVQLNEATNKSVIFISLTALVLTFSASGIASMGLFIGMYSVYNLATRLTIKNLMTSAAVIVFGVVLTVLSVTYVERIALYFETFSDIYTLIEEVEDLPFMVLSQLNNFYPVIYWFKSCIGESFGVCFFGGGLGTSFALNTRFYTEGLSNPHSYISRLLPELGIFGMFLFFWLFLSPVFKQIGGVARSITTFNPPTARIIKISLLALLAAVLGHKSNNLYLGLLMITLGLHFYGQAGLTDPAKGPSGKSPYA